MESFFLLEFWILLGTQGTGRLVQEIVSLLNSIMYVPANLKESSPSILSSGVPTKQDDKTF